MAKVQPVSLPFSAGGNQVCELYFSASHSSPSPTTNTHLTTRDFNVLSISAPSPSFLTLCIERVSKVNVTDIAISRWMQPRVEFAWAETNTLPCKRCSPWAAATRKWKQGPRPAQIWRHQTPKMNRKRPRQKRFAEGHRRNWHGYVQSSPKQSRRAPGGGSQLLFP